MGRRGGTRLSWSAWRVGLVGYEFFVEDEDGNGCLSRTGRVLCEVVESPTTGGVEGERGGRVDSLFRSSTRGPLLTSNSDSFPVDRRLTPEAC